MLQELILLFEKSMGFFLHYIINAEAMKENCAKVTLSLLLKELNLQLSKNEMGDSVPKLLYSGFIYWVKGWSKLFLDPFSVL